MDDFKIHHDVYKLMKLLSIQDVDKFGAENYVELLLKNTHPYSHSSADNKRKVSENSPNGKKFLEEYNHLKGRNLRELDPFVDLLAGLVDDEQTKYFLAKNAKQRADMSSDKIPFKMSSEPTVQLQQEIKANNVHVSESKRNVVVPPQPDWLFTRIALTADFMVDGSDDEKIDCLSEQPVRRQEELLVEDLLYCMQGIEGRYILVRSLMERYDTRTFMVDKTLDHSLNELVWRILPLCSNYSTVVRFIEEKFAFEYGLVNHALASSMRLMIQDYNVLVAQLEHQHCQGLLTLQKLWFYLQPTLKTMATVASIASTINKGECVGGAVLSVLHERTLGLQGDTKAHDLSLFLTRLACVPYFEILGKWIYKGIISDPYKEFLVKDVKKDVDLDSYSVNNNFWLKKYEICRANTPVFLEQMTEKILSTGKYLNVVRQCGQNVNCPYAEELVYSLKGRDFYSQIDKAYNYATKLLLDLLMEKEKLMARIRSLKNYFLLDKGDFIVQFMDMTEDEMKLDATDISTQRIESLLELVLRTSTANEDPFKDDLKIVFLKSDFTSQLLHILATKAYMPDTTDINLSGLEAFCFDYNLEWPVSLILNQEFVSYQLLFRHLFYCKHVERQLCNIWLKNKSSKYHIPQSWWYMASFTLLQQMLNFVQNFEYYMIFEVIEPCWNTFKTRMETVTTVEDVLKYHLDFLNSCMQHCLLTQLSLLSKLNKIMLVCVTFCNYIQRMSSNLRPEDEQQWLTQTSTLQAAPTARDRKLDPEKRKTAEKVVAEHMNQLAANNDFERAIKNFEFNFSKLLFDLLDEMMQGNDNNLKIFVYRLDYNGFYMDKRGSCPKSSTASVVQQNT